MIIYCCACQGNIEARLCSGEEVYNHRKDLWSLPFWKCDRCKNFVGCHHKNKNDPTKPLGVIATQEIKNIRMAVHNKIDPIWKGQFMTRKEVYSLMSEELGCDFHASNIRSPIEGKDALAAADSLFKGFY